MCTAISLITKEHYFGRNLDLDRSYGEEIAVMPRRYPISFRKNEPVNEHYAIIGMATVVERSETERFTEFGGLPLFYDAVNEHGLAVAGLNFPHNAFYQPVSESVEKNKCAVAPFEVIPWVLGQCKTVNEAHALLSQTTVTDISFSGAFPNTPLHFMFSDKERNVVVEPMRDGLFIYDNPIGVLTNNPPLLHQLENLKKYRDLKPDNSGFSEDAKEPYSSYSYGLGALGLPGDVSSKSRFVRAAFGKKNSVSDNSEQSSVGQFFHLLSSVEVVRGVCKTDEGSEHFTIYSSCINTERGIYYYTTYGNRQITSVNMHRTALDGEKIIRYSLLKEENICFQN